MAEFKEVMTQRERMCESCVVKGENCVSCLGHLQNIRENPKESELFILKWASENPIMTNADKFYEVFGVEATRKGCAGLKCLKGYGYTDCANCNIKDFWNQEYKEPDKEKNNG